MNSAAFLKPVEYSITRGFAAGPGTSRVHLFNSCMQYQTMEKRQPEHPESPRSNRSITSPSVPGLLRRFNTDAVTASL